MVSGCPERALSIVSLKLRAESEQRVDRHQRSSTILGPCALTAVNYLSNHLSFTDTYAPTCGQECTHTDMHKISFAHMHAHKHTCVGRKNNNNKTHHSRRGASFWLRLLVQSTPPDPTALPFSFCLFHSYATSLSLSLSHSQPKLGIQSASHP